ncbi:MAG TPA: hypothetical protein IAC73_01260 [Candidatus Limadaptatus stercoripullorum]|uniref:Uncharacterized protein n=1 Tax=Candidatus Limadaptatus stercoripullorum TaxID=2840846 RepID=A0A9D1N9J1_9FIRM|nr:hypothetical protein [Candidatus Limadaptatus stercoripullorum]
MKAASFVIGILVGMVLLVVAVGGGLAVALSVVTVGQIEDTVGTDIIDDESDANGQTLLDLAMSLMDDLADPSSITINLFREKYGLKIPAEISGIDISVLFDYPISEVANHLGDVVNNMTLRDVDEFLSLGLEEKYPDLSVLISNLDNNVDDALNNILASIDSSSMTLYSLETGFGITLGENRLFDELYHTPLSEFGEVMDLLPVGTLTGADSDLFLPVGENTVYVAVDRYEEVSDSELKLVADGAETYIAGADADENGLIRRELRYTRGEDGSYTPDNSCYAEDYDGTGTFYRHIVYEPYDGTQEGELFVMAYLNNFTADGKALVADGLFPLSSVYTDESLSVSLAETVTGGTVTVGEDVFINIAAEGETKVAEAVAVFGLPDGTVVDENTRLEEKKDGVSYTADHDHIRVHIGTADQAIQVIAGIGVSSLNNVTDKITSLNLGEVIDITDDSAKILRTLKDTQISKLSDALDTITLADATDIVLDEYSPATGGAYVLEDGSYTLYNPAKHAGAQRYQKTAVDGSSSAALQRLANVTIPNISAAFDTMVLGDAIGVIPDAYILVDSPESGETYYVFNKLGYPERAVYGVDEANAWYERVSSGEGNAILKQLAFVGINDISEAMNGVIEDTLLSDIIEIVRETAVKADEAGEYWLVAYDPYLTEGADGEETRYAFVYDGSGSYFRTSYLYTPATDALLPKGETMYFVYEEIANASDLADQTAVQNVFFRSADGKYYENPALAAYYAATNTDPTTWANKPYKRVAANAGDPGAESETVYPNGDSESGLYIEFFAAYVRYDAGNPAHWGRELFFKFTDGYTLSTADTKDETLYYYDFESGAYTSSQSASTSDALVMMTGRDDGKYYFSEINGVRAADDKAFASGDTVYSKRLAEVIYKLADNGSFVYEDGGYVAYDPDRHADVTERYDRVTGVLVNKAGNDGGEGLLAPLSTDRVSVVREKSSSVLIAMLDRELTIGTLDENIKSFTIEELIDIESGSVFDDPTIRKATVDTLSDAITAKLTNSSIGELIRWANVRGVDEKVLFILEDVKVSDFFTALEYKNGTITVNMEKLLGVN